MILSPTPGRSINPRLGTARAERVSYSIAEYYGTDPIPEASAFSMTWITTVPITQADDKLRKALQDERALYPKEYASPVHPSPDGGASEIVASHSLLPDALYHAFATFGVLMSPELPLQRRQHEMIATMVSVTNRCVY
jgi:hypothetical protein